MPTRLSCRALLIIVLVGDNLSWAPGLPPAKSGPKVPVTGVSQLRYKVYTIKQRNGQCRIKTDTAARGFADLEGPQVARKY